MSRVFVIGGANVDISGKSVQRLKMFDSNPGIITTSFGGVGRNIATNLCLLGVEVYFITVFSNDLYGVQIKKNCEDMGMNCSLSKTVEDERTSVYLAILDDNNDMSLAMSDMSILNKIDFGMIEAVLNEIRCDDLLVIDTNLDKEMIKTIATQARCKVVMDPISITKAEKIKDCLGMFSILKPNIFESRVFTNIVINDNVTAKSTLEFYLNEGVEEPIISLGEEGVIAAYGNEKLWVRHRNVDVVNATGGGDAFFASYIYARMKKYPLKESIEFAIGAAVSTITCMDSVNPLLSLSLINKTIEELELVSNNL